MRRWMGLTAILVSACASVQTSVDDGTAATTKAEIAQGMAYSVPIQLIRVNLSRTMETVTDLDELAAAYYDADRVAKAAEAQLAALKAARDQLEELARLANATGSSVTAEQRGEIEKARNSAKVVFEDFDKRVDVLQGKRSAALDALKAATNEDTKEIKWERKRPVDKIDITLLPYSADPRFEFVATFPHNIFRMESHGVAANEKGLLQSTDLKTDDATQELLVAVASLYGLKQSKVEMPSYTLENAWLTSDMEFNKQFDLKLLKLSGKSIDDLLMSILIQLEKATPPAAPPSPDCEPSKSSTPAVEDLNKTTGASAEALAISKPDPWNHTYADEDAQKTTGEFSRSFTIDPLSSDAVSRFNIQACKLNSNLRLQVFSGAGSTGAEDGGFPVESRVEPTTVSYETDSAEGIVYRQLRPVVLNVTENILTPDLQTDQFLLKSELVDMPNGAPLRRITDFGSAFSTRTSTLKFNNGLLIDYKFTRPSEVGEAATALVAVAKAPFEIVSEVVKLNVDTAGGQKSIAETSLAIEKLRLEQELALVEKADAAETKLAQNALARGKAEQELDALILKSDIETLTQDDAKSLAELQADIDVLKKRKEFLMLQKEVEDLESGE